MIKNKTILFFTSLLFVIISCDDVFEEDISNEIVELLFPKEGMVVEANQTPFQWTDVEDADAFRVQIAQENGLIVRDTLVNSLAFVEALGVGKYKWRVRAENFAYKTEYSGYANFVIAAPTDLSDISVVLISPLNDVFTNFTNIEFRWESIETATSYVFKLFRVANGVEENVFEVDDLKVPAIKIDENLLVNDGEYKWTVVAINEISETATTEVSRVISLDTQKPPKPQLEKPLNEEEFDLTDEVAFEWSVVDVGLINSTLKSRIEIASSSDFADIIEANVTNEFEHKYTPTEVGTFYWRVVVTDEAGNEGEFESSGKFVVN